MEDRRVSEDVRKQAEAIAEALSRRQPTREGGIAALKPVAIDDVDSELAAMGLAACCGATEGIPRRFDAIFLSVASFGFVPAAGNDAAARAKLRAALKSAAIFLRTIPEPLFERLCRESSHPSIRANRLWRCMAQDAWRARNLNPIGAPLISAELDELLDSATTAATNPGQLGTFEGLVSGRIRNGLAAVAKTDQNTDGMQIRFFEFAQLFQTPGVQNAATWLSNAWPTEHAPTGDCAEFIADSMMNASLCGATSPAWWTAEMRTLLTAKLGALQTADPVTSAVPVRRLVVIHAMRFLHGVVPPADAQTGQQMAVALQVAAMASEGVADLRARVKAMVSQVPALGAVLI